MKVSLRRPVAAVRPSEGKVRPGDDEGLPRRCFPKGAAGRRKVRLVSPCVAELRDAIQAEFCEIEKVS